MRTLIYVPIVHSEADLGSLACELNSRFKSAFGEEVLNRRRASIEDMWAGLERKLLALPLEWPRTKLYQDGLPVCGKEFEIVRDLACQGSRNYQILLKLMELGAILTGTEDAGLVVKDYRRIQRLIEAASSGEDDRLLDELRIEGDALLRERDAFIANRIEATLCEGETGMLFIGLLHHVDEILNRGFEVRHLIHSLPFAADPWRRLKERTNAV